MTAPRFTVEKARAFLGRSLVAGWIVFDRECPITIPFANYTDALRHRDNIAAIYARYGW